MRHGSLFSGIGGFDLAAEWMGWENVFHCEWNEFGQKILQYYWPKAISYHDITKTDFTIHRGQIDVLTGGFPCQPFSQAGKRKGATDDRYLWPEMLRAIKEIQPTWVIGENVAGITNMVFEPVLNKVESEIGVGETTHYQHMDGEGIMLRIIEQLEEIGYEVQPILIPAASVGAPHRRDRVWFVANSVNGGDFGFTGKHEKEGGEKRLSERHKVQQSQKPISVRQQLEPLIVNALDGRNRKFSGPTKKTLRLSRFDRKKRRSRLLNGAAVNDRNASHSLAGS